MGTMIGILERCFHAPSEGSPDPFANAFALGVLAHAGARIGAIAKLKLGDFQDQAEQWVPLFVEKGGKARQIPVRHDLEGWIKD